MGEFRRPLALLRIDDDVDDLRLPVLTPDLYIYDQHKLQLALLTGTFVTCAFPGSRYCAAAFGDAHALPKPQAPRVVKRQQPQQPQPAEGSTAETGEEPLSECSGLVEFSGRTLSLFLTVDLVFFVVEHQGMVVRRRRLNGWTWSRMVIVGRLSSAH